MSTQPLKSQNFNSAPWCVRTDVSLKITKAVRFSQWEAEFKKLDKTRAGHQWWIGDALNEGERMFPEDYAQVIDPDEEDAREENSGESYRQYQQVSCRIEDGRRLPTVSWSHHQAVAYLPPEQQDYWLARARDERPRISVHKLRKLVKGEKDAEIETDPDLYVLQDPLVREYLNNDIESLRAQFPQVPENAPFLRDQLISRIEASQWQLDRTVETDCDIVREAVSELLGTSYQVFNWLKIRSRIISPPDVRVYLGMLVAAGRVIEEKDEKPNPLAKGTTPTVYKPKRNTSDDEKDAERRQKSATV